MFTVDASRYPEGFNLTHLNVQGSGTHSPTVAIYRGTSLNEANKLTEFTPSYFSYYLDVQLEEQFYFAPGESFLRGASFPGIGHPVSPWRGTGLVGSRGSNPGLYVERQRPDMDAALGSSQRL